MLRIFVRLPKAFDAATLAHYSPSVSLEVANADKTPLEEDSEYHKASRRFGSSVLDNVKAQLLLLLHLDLLGNPIATQYPCSLSSWG